MIASQFIRYEVPKESANDPQPLSPTALSSLYKQVENDSRNTDRINRRVGKKLRMLREKRGKN